ncbi:PREDICTED: early endosome antigen 1-like isoform X1 [Acromyrmex echinatior]|uniref:Uncharacterized protein n=2 Tax=Acromyrmex echinatior TaxID=103372 RepID=F4WGA9_ACREC|nr:PREDICTED: early endosome antigen 1-like isoform X1 [Acromyrmex echinatior]EGI66876.1 hypothetical protein G5I_04683 [Acromyrmex echinatior]
MDDENMPSVQDFSQLERQFREQFYELQSNMITLQTTQKELLETRHALYSTELELEKERRVSHELKMRLRVVTEVANESQQQQTKNQVESVQLRIKYDAMTKQCESLMSQAAAAKTHEAECKIKIRSLEEKLHQRDTSNKIMEQALKKLEYDNSRVIAAIDHKIAKLKEEHRYLQKSCEDTIILNQRLQTVGLCTHAIHQKDKAKIKELEHMLASMMIRNTGSAQESVNYDAHSKENYHLHKE